MKVLDMVLSQISPCTTSTERARVLVESLRHAGVDLRTQPSLEEMKQLLTKVLRG
jgi:hypothetical protein